MQTLTAEESVRHALEAIRGDLPLEVTRWRVTKRPDSVGVPALFVDAVLAHDDVTDRDALTGAHDAIWRTAMDHRLDPDLWVYVQYVGGEE